MYHHDTTGPASGLKTLLEPFHDLIVAFSEDCVFGIFRIPIVECGGLLLCRSPDGLELSPYASPPRRVYFFPKHVSFDVSYSRPS